MGLVNQAHSDHPSSPASSNGRTRSENRGIHTPEISKLHRRDQGEGPGIDGEKLASLTKPRHPGADGTFLGPAYGAGKDPVMKQAWSTNPRNHEDGVASG